MLITMLWYFSPVQSVLSIDLFELHIALLVINSISCLLAFLMSIRSLREMSGIEHDLDSVVLLF